MLHTPPEPTSFDRMIRRSQVMRERKYRPYHAEVDIVVSSHPCARRIWRAWDTHDKTTFLAEYIARFNVVTAAVAQAIIDRATQLLTRPEVYYEHD